MSVLPGEFHSFEAAGILQGEHEGQRRERSDPLDLPQQVRFWVVLFRDRIQLSVVGSDALRKRADLLQDGPKGRQKRLGDVLFGPLVEAPGRALGQASPEGFDRSTDVGDQLRGGTHQRLTRADYGHMGLGLFAPVFEWVEQLRVEARKSLARLSASTSSVSCLFE